MSEYRVVLRSICGDPAFDQWLDKLSGGRTWEEAFTRANALKGAGYQQVTVESREAGALEWVEETSWMTSRQTS